MNSETPLNSTGADERFAERLRAAGRIEPPAEDSVELRRLHRATRERLRATKPGRPLRLLAAAAGLTLFALVSLMSRQKLQPAVAPASVAASAVDDAADDKLLRAVQACRTTPDVGGLRNAFSAGLEIPTSSGLRNSSPATTATPDPEKGARS